MYCAGYRAVEPRALLSQVSHYAALVATIICNWTGRPVTLIAHACIGTANNAQRARAWRKEIALVAAWPSETREPPSSVQKLMGDVQGVMIRLALAASSSGGAPDQSSPK
jgi:hypothetical protein